MVWLGGGGGKKGGGEEVTHEEKGKEELKLSIEQFKRGHSHPTRKKNPLDVGRVSVTISLLTNPSGGGKNPGENTI